MKIPIPSGSTEVEVTFPSAEPPPNEIPIVNAGANQTIKLPTSTVTLKGSATDPDGTIAAYRWVKDSGSGNVLTPDAAETQVTGLAQGTSVFRLIATDSAGATVSDDLSVIVQAADATPPPGGNYGTLVFARDFDKASDITPGQLAEGSFSTKDGGCFLSKVTGKVYTSGGYRSEQQFDGSLYNPTEFVLEYEANYENWKNFGTNSGCVVQWHPHASGGSATISIYGYTGEYEVVRNISGTNYHDSAYIGGKKQIVPNKWVKHRWEIKWGNPGYVKLYLDDVLYFSFTGTTKVESQNPYFKLGQNRWFTNGTTVVYYRKLKIWKK